MNTANPVIGGAYGTVAALQAFTIGELLPAVVLSAQFTAVGPSAAVPIPSGVTTGQIRTFVSGTPSAATVVMEASLDAQTWVPLPPWPAVAVPTEYLFVRLNCTALTGGSSPTIAVSAFATP